MKSKMLDVVSSEVQERVVGYRSGSWIPGDGVLSIRRHAVSSCFRFWATRANLRENNRTLFFSKKKIIKLKINESPGLSKIYRLRDPYRILQNEETGHGFLFQSGDVGLEFPTCTIRVSPSVVRVVRHGPQRCQMDPLTLKGVCQMDQ